VAKKTIAVVGATGAQGGGLMRAILEDASGGFAARALTRDVNGAKPRALAELGAEVVAADVDDPASLRRAFDGAYGAYCVTFYWDHMKPEKEKVQAANMARAAKDAGLQHVIWSTLEDTRRFVPLSDDRMPTLMGQYKVPHFDAKGESNRFFGELGVPTTFLLASFYWDNLIHFGMGPKKLPDGMLAFVLPTGDKRMPGIAAEDIGRCAYGIYRRGLELVGRAVGIAGDHPTGAQMAAELSKALGRTIVHAAISPAEYRAFAFPGADDLGNMFQFYAEFEQQVCATRDVAVSRSLNPRLQTFAQWAQANRGRIPVEA
jgi:uncharacterized protein YbjT (DUF2867 family)